MTDGENLNSHARGSLLGLAVGDALGTTLEFKRCPEAPWDPLVSGPHVNVTGGGPFRVLPGQVTDDTMMACCLAASLKTCEGLDTEDVAQRYVDWRGKTFDCGGQTGSSLSAVASGTSALLSGKSTWERGRNAAGNGSLMRTAPIGVYFAGRMIDIVSASVLDSNITHFDPRCSLACAAYNCAVGEAMTLPTPAAMFRAAWNGLHVAAGYFLSSFPDTYNEVYSALEVLKEDLEASQNDDPQLYGPKLHLQGMQGFVRVGFRLAFWEMFHAPDYRSALIDTVNRGGDADTNGAIVGGLVGALFGDKSIPEEWKTTVINCNPSGSLGKAGALHPDRMLELLEDL